MFVGEGLFGKSIVAVCELHELYRMGGEGTIGVDMWVGAPSMFKMFGLNLA